MSRESYPHKIIASATAVLLVGSLSLRGSKEVADSPSCIVPTEVELAKTEALLSAPMHPGLMPPPSPEKSKGGEIIREAHYQEQAKKLRVTIYDGSGVLEHMGTPQNETEAQPFDFYYQPARDFMKQFGVKLEIGTRGEQYSYNGRAPEAAELESLNAKWLMANIVQAFSNVPQEYVDITGLKRIVIITGTEAQDVAGYATVEDRHDAIYLDIDRTARGSLGTQGVRHEVAHLLDAAQCGDVDMWVDESFVALNNGTPIYSGEKWDSTYPSYSGSFMRYELGYYNSLHQALLLGKTAACGVWQENKKRAAEVVAYSDYHPNPVEDKAEIGSKLPDTNDYVTMSDSKYTMMYRKFRFLLARLYRQNPKIVEYFTTTSRRPVVDPQTADC